jgi:hypothetical protein
MKISSISENYENLPEGDHFEFPEECSLCGQLVTFENFSTCRCGEVYCFDCLKKRMQRPGVDPRLIWRFNRIKDSRGNYVRDVQHLWRCRACFEFPFHERMGYGE